MHDQVHERFLGSVWLVFAIRLMYHLLYETRISDRDYHSVVPLHSVAVEVDTCLAVVLCLLQCTVGFLQVLDRCLAY